MVIRAEAMVIIRRVRYWLTARRCVCRGYPRRFAGGTVQIGETLHRLDGPCYQCDSYGREVGT